MWEMIRPVTALRAASRYLRQHPEEISRAFRNAIAMRVGVPLAAFRWIAEEAIDPEKVEAVEIEATPPGLRLAGSFDLMKTRVRGGAVLYVDRVIISATELRMELRVEEVVMTPLEPKKTQISALLRAQALDLSRPGDLVANLPDMPPMIVEAIGNRISLDLMKVPRLAKDDRVRHALGMMTSLVTLDRMQSEEDHFDLSFKPIPQGVSGVVEAIGDHVLGPAMGAVKSLLPGDLGGELEAGVNRVVDVVAGPDPGVPGDAASTAPA
jgi:hypothetical protein